MKKVLDATESLVNRKQTYYFVIAISLLFSLGAVTLGVVSGEGRGPGRGRDESRQGSNLAASFDVSTSPTVATPNPSQASMAPSLGPSTSPSLGLSSSPTVGPTSSPTSSPTLGSTASPTLPPTISEAPTVFNLTDFDSNFTLFPGNESFTLSPAPTVAAVESPAPTVAAVESPTLVPTVLTTTTTTTTTTMDQEIIGTRFYAIGDVPYSPREAEELQVQIDQLEDDAEFVIHVGDIREGKDSKRPCTMEEFHAVADILNKSHAPVFIIFGDNDWNDCPNIDEAYDYWMTIFGRFDEQWDHSFDVQRHETKPENFLFLHKRTLFFGLNIVGGKLHDREEWKDRLTTLFEWVQDGVNTKILSDQEADSVVIFGHADPKKDHSDFFDPLSDFMEEEGVSDIPFLYVNGDKHKWDYDEKFYSRPNFLRIQVEGGTREPPLQITLDNDAASNTKPLSEVFVYDRMLPLTSIG